MVAGFSVTQIAGDMRTMYGTAFDEDTLEIYRRLFVEQQYCDGVFWENYVTCVDPGEYVMKTRLKLEPKDFVRWKLGVPVSLDAETVLNRLMSDAYYTERLIKHGRRDPSDPGALPGLDRDDLVRIKLERETIFKCMDRIAKLREAGQSEDKDTEAMAVLKRIAIQTDNETFASLDSLKDG